MRALLQERLDNGKIRCNVCAHRCELSDSQVGICRIRQRVGDSIEYLADESGWMPCPHISKCGADSYCSGKPSCSWSCSFCSTGTQTIPEISVARDGGAVPDETFPEEARRSEMPITEDGFTDRLGILGHKLTVLPTLDWHAQHAKKAGTPDNESLLAAWRASGKEWFGMRQTEPSIHLESVREVFAQVKAEGGHVMIHTNGYWTPQLVEELAPLIDGVDVGVKGSANKLFLRKVAGVPDPAPIFETIKALAERGIWVKISDIPIYHATWREDFARLVEFIAETIPARDLPRLLLYPWGGWLPWVTFGHFKPGIPVEVAPGAAMSYSRSALLADATKIALDALESVWLQLPAFSMAKVELDKRNNDFARLENIELGQRLSNEGYAMSGEGMFLRVARSQEELGTLHEKAEMLA